MANQIMAMFSDEHDLLHATRAAHGQRMGIVDAYTPYPVHGLDDAMGMKRTRIAVVCFVLGCFGMLVGFGIQYWIMAVDWPINIGGKSFVALPALIPVTFEAAILVAALGTVVTFFIRSKMFPGKPTNVAVSAATNDKFILVLEDQDVETISAMFKEHNVLSVQVMEV